MRKWIGKSFVKFRVLCPSEGLRPSMLDKGKKMIGSLLIMPDGKRGYLFIPHLLSAYCVPGPILALGIQQ